MFRIPLPLEDDPALLLCPRWGSLDPTLQLFLLGLLLVLPLALVVWLYRYEMRLVRPFAARSLLALRLLVIFFLWCIVGLQPALVYESSEEIPPRVLIAVDRSDSMEVTDPQRSNLEKLRTARSLKLKVPGEELSDALLNDWIKQYQDKGPNASLQWVADNEFNGDTQRRAKLVEKRRAMHDQLCQQVDQLTRTEMARKILDRGSIALLETLITKHKMKVELIGFHQKAWELKPEQLDELFRRPRADKPKPPDEKKLPRPDEEPPVFKDAGPAALSAFTDLRWPLLRARERVKADQGKILGVVVLTDGQHNWGPSPKLLLNEAAQGRKKTQRTVKPAEKIALYPIGLGARPPEPDVPVNGGKAASENEIPRKWGAAPPDVAVIGVKAQTTVFKDVDASVEALVKINGLPPQKVVVKLHRPGQEPLEETIDHKGNDPQTGKGAEYAVSFRVRMDKVGLQPLTVTVEPLPDEINKENNSRSVVVNVVDDQAEVLIVDGEARWEYHYLANALMRDRTLKVKKVVFSQPRLNIPEEDLEEHGYPWLRLPPRPEKRTIQGKEIAPEPDPLTKYDCIILGDVSPEQLPLEARERLEEYVANRGGTLVLLAGKRFMPKAFEKEDVVAEKETDPLLKMLPILEPRVVSPRLGFPVTLTQLGKQTTYLQMESTPAESADRWAQLPLHYWGIVGKAKPGAEPLAFYVEDEDKEAVALDKKVKYEPEREKALIVRQTYGFGRVLFVGLDSTWRWRFKKGDTYHHRFWGQVIRWAASEPLPAGNDQVRYGTPEPVYRQGDKMDVLVRLGDSVDRRKLKNRAGANILRKTLDGKEEPVALVRLSPREGQRVLEGRIPELAPGQYRIELAIPDLKDELKLQPSDDRRKAWQRDTFFVTSPQGEEMVDLATNWPDLIDMAEKTGGKVFTAENAASLADLLAREAQKPEYRTVIQHPPSDHKLWQFWPTLVLFLVLVTAEWVGRKLAGLP
jgi:hypothetical protein